MHNDLVDTLRIMFSEKKNLKRLHTFVIGEGHLPEIESQ